MSNINERAVDVEGAANAQQDYGYKRNFKKALSQILAVGVKNILLASFGMTLGFPTILIPKLGAHQTEGETIHLSDYELSWIGSINLICVPLGCLGSGVLTNLLGRRRAMQLGALPVVAAWLMFHFASGLETLLAALCLTGLAGGLLVAPVFSFVAEIAQPHLRGMLSAASSTCIVFGIFTQFVLGVFFYWRTIALVNISTSVIAMVCLFFVPESPYWLISKNRLDKAKKSLQWLRGWVSEFEIEDEFRTIFDSLKNVPENKAQNTKSIAQKAYRTFLKYTKNTFYKPYLLVCLSFFIGHFSGMTTLQTYAVRIFCAVDSPMDLYYATTVIGLLQFSGALVFVTAVGFVGKRPLVLFSVLWTGLCGAIVFIYELFRVRAPSPWTPTIALFTLAFLSHAGLKLLPWVLIGEVFPSKTRSVASGLAGGTGYIFSFIANNIFLRMLAHLSVGGTYLIYCIISFTGFILLYYCLPETEGKLISEIEDHYSGIKELSNNINKRTKVNKNTPKPESFKQLHGGSSNNWKQNDGFEMDIVYHQTIDP